MNRKTDQWILAIFLPGFRIQSIFFNGFSDPAIVVDPWFHPIFGPGFGFCFNKVRIADLNDPQKCFALFNLLFFAHAQDRLTAPHSVRKCRIVGLTSDF